MNIMSSNNYYTSRKHLKPSKPSRVPEGIFLASQLSLYSIPDFIIKELTCIVSPKCYNANFEVDKFDMYG